jgi:two-component system chemotaxis sensor kinase CheA
MDMSQYLEIFIEESRENLQTLNESILQLEKNPNNKTLLNEIFRVAHTLKGMTGTMGFNKMAKLTHAMENVLDALRSGQRKVSTDIIDLMFKCFDALELYVQNIITDENEGNEDNKQIIDKLKKVLDGEEDNTKETIEDTKEKVEENSLATLKLDDFELNAIDKAIEMKLSVYRITIILNQNCVLKSARAFIVFQTLEKYSEIIKSEPPVKEIEDEKFDFDMTVVVISDQKLNVFKNQLEQIAEIEEVKILEIKTSSDFNDDVEEEEEEKQELEVKKEDNTETKKSNQTKKSTSSKTLRVGIQRLDNLMNLVSELIIIKTRLAGIDDFDNLQNYNEAVEYLERITTNLHETVMKVRMVPIETVFNRFPRMIRDVSKDIGKEINLEMSGEETELDKTVIDEIGEPLIHILRNSADHGIETKDGRRKANKSVVGHIHLRAYQVGNSVVIEVEDDGGGINTEKVKEKIIKKGILSKESANALNQSEIIEYLFKPSFSTADKVTNLSGRGVGLDVVKTKIETLGGVIEVESELGKGSKFRIILPLTLAIIQALLVGIEEEKYAIPLGNIQEVIKVDRKEIKFVQKKEVIVLRDTVIPIIRLKEKLGIESEREDNMGIYNVVIVKKGDKLSGFIIDYLIGQQETVIKSLGKLLSGIKNIAGATILGDGSVALILDINSLV